MNDRITNEKNRLMDGTDQMVEKKQVAAMMAAVAAYMEEEQAAMLPGAAAEPEKAPAAALKPWGISGRQTQMTNRQLMQMRAFR